MVIGRDIAHLCFKNIVLGHGMDENYQFMALVDLNHWFIAMQYYAVL